MKNILFFRKASDVCIYQERSCTFKWNTSCFCNLVKEKEVEGVLFKMESNDNLSTSNTRLVFIGK